MTEHRLKSRISDPRAGMSLLETLMYIAILGVFINLGVTSFVSAQRLSAVARDSVDRAATLQELDRHFRSAVRESIAVRPALTPFASGPEQLVLELPAKEGHPRYVVWHTTVDPKHLMRTQVVQRDGGYGVEHRTVYALDLAALRFHYDAEHVTDARRITLEFSREPVARPAATPTPHRIVAVRRGIGGTTGGKGGV